MGQLRKLWWGLVAVVSNARSYRWAQRSRRQIGLGPRALWLIHGGSFRRME